MIVSEGTNPLNPIPREEVTATEMADKEINMVRANRVVVRNEADGFVAEFFKTHKHITEVFSEDTEWVRNKEHSQTQAREDFRTWVQSHAEEFEVDWSPEYQAQAWDRHYWKYENDAQVEEDARELMSWTIAKLAQNTGLDVEVTSVNLDTMVPMESPLTYVEDGKYVKNGNWAVATVRLSVEMQMGDRTEEIAYDIEMRSGQLTKIKMNAEEFKTMVKEVFEVVA